MGHSTNLNTLRQIKQHNIYYKKNSKEFLLAYTYQNLLEKLFRRNKIFLTKCNIVFNQNKFYCSMNLFFQHRSFIRIKKRIKQNTLKKCSSLNLTSLLLFKQNLLFIKYLNLNTRIEPYRLFLKKYLLKQTKRFSYSLFPRRFSFFKDFLQLSVLFFIGELDDNYYLRLLGEVFRILQKRRHSKYLVFITFYFKLLFFKFKKRNLLSKILGLKFVINGKLKGKTRSNFFKLNVGSMPNQTLMLNIHFTKTPIYTIYGVFGFKLWVFRNHK